MKSQPCACLVFAVLSAAPLSAGDFVNLGFDDPDLSHAVPYQSGPILGQSMPTSEAFRGWLFSSDNSPTPSRVFINVGTTPPVSLIPSGKFPGTGVDFGKYALYLASPSQAPGSLQPLYHLSQSGTIPAGATELVYYRSGGQAPAGTPGAFQILINGQSIPYREFGISYADVSAFAGQEVTMEFLFPRGNGAFDIAGFNIVPEPSTYALLGLGAAALGWQCRRRSHS